MTPTSARLAVGSLAALLVVMVPSGVSASGGDDEVRISGLCKGGSSTWEMRARTDSDNRIEVRGEVDHTTSGKVWSWKIKHNGSVSSMGRTVSRAGQLEVRRSLVDLPGTDHCVFRAVQPTTGEVCRGVIDW
ncbi:MAG: hypothetical protein ABIO16_14985 [Nocardioides sp.]